MLMGVQIRQMRVSLCQKHLANCVYACGYLFPERLVEVLSLLGNLILLLSTCSAQHNVSSMPQIPA